MVSKSSHREKHQNHKYVFLFPHSAVCPRSVVTLASTLYSLDDPRSYTRNTEIPVVDGNETFILQVKNASIPLLTDMHFGLSFIEGFLSVFFMKFSIKQGHNASDLCILCRTKNNIKGFAVTKSAKYFTEVNCCCFRTESSVHYSYIRCPESTMIIVIIPFSNWRLYSTC